MNIKELRISSNMTQQEFSTYFNIPKRTIENWEGGKRNPPEYLVELMEYKLEKEKIMMLKNLGNFQLREGEYKQVLYIGIIGGMITVDETYTVPIPDTGKIVVEHNGTFFGDYDAMINWIKDETIHHLIEDKIIVRDGETISGDKLWKWNV